MESLEIEIDVNESYINRVAAGQAVEATLDAYPEWKIPSKVIAIIPTADRQKSAVTVSKTRSDEAVISAGVAAGERVIVDGPAGLVDGAAVVEKRGNR